MSYVAPLSLVSADWLFAYSTSRAMTSAMVNQNGIKVSGQDFPYTDGEISVAAVQAYLNGNPGAFEKLYDNIASNNLETGEAISWVPSSINGHPGAEGDGSLFTSPATVSLPGEAYQVVMVLSAYAKGQFFTITNGGSVVLEIGASYNASRDCYVKVAGTHWVEEGENFQNETPCLLHVSVDASGVPTLKIDGVEVTLIPDNDPAPIPSMGTALVFLGGSSLRKLVEGVGCSGTTDISAVIADMTTYYGL